MASLAAVGIACLFGLAVASAASTTVHPMAGSEARFALIVHHTDGEREWAYDPKSHIGHLDKALDEAHARVASRQHQGRLANDLPMLTGGRRCTRKDGEV